MFQALLKNNLFFVDVDSTEFHKIMDLGLLNVFTIIFFWLNWVDEDEVGLKEKLEDAGYIKIRPEVFKVFEPNR